MKSPNGSTTSGAGSAEIAFLGVVDRAQLVSELGTNLPKWNMLGLKSFMLVNFLPLGQLTIVVMAPDGNQVGSMTLGTQAIAARA